MFSWDVYDGMYNGVLTEYMFFCVGISIKYREETKYCTALAHSTAPFFALAGAQNDTKKPEEATYFFSFRNLLVFGRRSHRLPPVYFETM